MSTAVMSLTDSAADRVKHLMATRTEPATGLRIGVRTGGCSGMAYSMEFAQEQEPLDEVVEEKGVKLFVNSKALMFLIGTEMDYVEDKLQSGFVFKNPNEKGRCGCGSPFIHESCEFETYTDGGDPPPLCFIK